MNANQSDMYFSQENSQPFIGVGATRITDLASLVEMLPGLKESNQLVAYCQAVNHLTYGTEYQLILEPQNFREKYQSRLAAEDPQVPWQDGAPRLCDFGVCDTSEIQPPRLEDSQCIFYVEDGLLGLPYRVVAPSPIHLQGEVTYEPLPVTPLTES